MNENIKACTRCSAPFDDMKVEINLQTTVERRRSDYKWERITNMNLQSKEVLCIKCFGLFASQLKYLNKKKEEKPESATDIISPPVKKEFVDKVQKATVKESIDIPPQDYSPEIVYAKEN